MMESLAVVAGVGSAAVGGVYAAFSTIVMPALQTRPEGEAATTMNAVNVHAVRAPFMSLFFGTAAACAAVAIAGAVAPTPGSVVRIGGAVSSLAGVVLTIGVNVPLNTGLARGDGWTAFARPWVRANHARAVLSLVGAVALLA